MAYTKYSLTPANNNATPPDGAPEGMLPSAVNDTMRDMMAQIRDVGDGIRNGTYTMTAPVITGGSITGVALSGNTFTNPVITGGSINNTPIGGTTANSGAFTTLSASGVATISAGTVSAPALTTTGDTNTGIFFPAADTIAFTEGGVESMRIDSSGRVLIGSSSAVGSPIFQVNGNASINGGNKLYLWNTANNNAPYIANAGSSAIAIYDTSDNQRLIVDNSGNVGIGTSSPAYKLSVNAGATSTRISAETAGGVYYTRLVASQNFAYSGIEYNSLFNFVDGSTERMRIDSSGNVGIGTSSPTSFSGYTVVDAYNGTTGAFFLVRNPTKTGQFTVDTNGVRIGSRTNDFLALTTNDTERMRIDSSGRLLVGRTASGLSNSTGVTIGDGSIGIQSEGNNVQLYLNRTTSDGTIVEFRRNNTAVGSISVTTTATAYNTSSDYRLKENIAPMQGALNVVAQLKPVTYNWKVDGSAGQGFIAHELQAVMPDCVSGDKDAVDADGKPVYQGVDTSFLVAILTSAIQEQQAMIEELKSKVEALEAK